MAEADTEGEDGTVGTSRDASAARLAVWVTVVRYRVGEDAQEANTRPTPTTMTNDQSLGMCSPTSCAGT
ncbi:MAG: hypothetical protein A2638_00250 [Nitrospirae bacterium RIFCSPHIGHO2_01_FULL_66_17]|nr:MAG: hypothetical protein A2638_00250 [Nitrospirae bacterium RIFCSPHIGHO2_01_FULL_66_17]